jgi:hypothetical protein
VRASLGEVFYNVTVTPTEMWQAVGLELQRVRLGRKLKPIQVERAGDIVDSGPDLLSYLGF